MSTGSHRDGVPVGAVVVATCVGAGVGGLAWLGGVSLGFALAMTVLVAGAGVAWSGFSGVGIDVLPRSQPRPRPGTRGDVSQLSWTMRSRDARVSDAAARRLRAFARRRLRRFGLELDEPRDRAAIRALIGADACDLLAGTGRPTLRDLERCLDALERTVSGYGGERGAIAS